MQYRILILGVSLAFSILAIKAFATMSSTVNFIYGYIGIGFLLIALILYFVATRIGS